MLLFRTHAIQRMFERGINEADVSQTLATGKTIMNYPDDQPYPSRLVLGFVDGRPIHVVAADNAADGTTIIITVYEPNPDLWEPGFERRKKP